MKIRIVTERKIYDEDFWPWAKEVIEAFRDKPGKPVTRNDFQRLLDTGELVITDDLGYTKVSTKYQIIREEKSNGV